MKIIQLCLVICLLSQLVGCGDSDESTPEGPTVFLNPNFGNADIGGVITTSVEITAPAGFTSLEITPIFDEIRDEANAMVIASAFMGQMDTTFTYSFTETTRRVAATSVVDIEFLLTDNLDRTDTAFFRVGVNGPPIRIVSEGSFMPPQSDMAGSSSSFTFFSSSNDLFIWSVDQVNAETNDVSGDIDFGYYYNTTTSSATLASVFDYPIVNLAGIDTWTARNQTKFRRTSLSTEEFDQAFSSSSAFMILYNAFENGTAGDREERVTDLAVDDVIAFETDESKTDGSKRGLIRVHDIQAGDGPGDFIRISIIYER